MNRTTRRISTNGSRITNRGGIWGASFTRTDSGKPNTVTTLWINSLIAR